MVDTALAGFDWGAGCDGGSGSFKVNLTTAGQLVDVGQIPAGKWNVKVFLSSSVSFDLFMTFTSDSTLFFILTFFFFFFFFFLLSSFFAPPP
jgi:hypothetical protein